jgi:hypothetical protein
MARLCVMVPATAPLGCHPRLYAEDPPQWAECGWLGPRDKPTPVRFSIGQSSPARLRHDAPAPPANTPPCSSPSPSPRLRFALPIHALGSLGHEPGAPSARPERRRAYDDGGSPSLTQRHARVMAEPCSRLSGWVLMDKEHGVDSSVIRELGGFIGHGRGSTPCGMRIA